MLYIELLIELSEDKTMACELSKANRFCSFCEGLVFPPPICEANRPLRGWLRQLRALRKLLVLCLS